MSESAATNSRVDVLILTFNEAAQIADAIANASRVGRVFVLDSGSTDGTQQLARDAGAVVIEHPFENYSRQKNWGIDHVPFSADWILILDADERVTPQLRTEILAKTRPGVSVRGYYINRLLIFMGRPIRHGGMYPWYHLRLFRRGAARYEDRAVSEYMVCRGRTAFLKGELLHVRRESTTRFISRLIRHADMESDEWIKNRAGQSGAAPTANLFSDHMRYRHWIARNLWPRIPFRPAIRFLWMWIVRLGLLDGTPGWQLAQQMASYEYMIGLLYREKLASRKSTSGIAPADLCRLSKAIYTDGSPLLRTLQHLRPKICPFEVILPYVKDDSSVLDIGCGAGLFLGLLAATGKRLRRGVGFDISVPAIDVAQKMAAKIPAVQEQNAVRLEFHRLDLNEAWPDGSFDVTALVDVLHHVPPAKQRDLFEKAARLLPAGGTLVYKDMCRRPRWRAFMNRMHDLVVARQWIHYVPIADIERWAEALGMETVHSEYIPRWWYGHELRIFKRR